MEKPYMKRLISLAFLFLSLTLVSCDYDDTVMPPSSWASILVVGAVALFFYYVFKMFRRK